MSKRSTSISAKLPAYRTSFLPLAGHRFSGLVREFRSLLLAIEKKSNRQAYLRSAYFQKQKIFLTHYWSHLQQKPRPERIRRMKYLPCGLDLVRHSRLQPFTVENVDAPNELLHRFAGVTKKGVRFYVQIKEFKRSGRKELLSVFITQKNPLPS